MDMELFKEIASKCNGSLIDGCLDEIARLRQQVATLEAERDKLTIDAVEQINMITEQRDIVVEAIQYYISNSSDHITAVGDFVVSTCSSREMAGQALAAIQSAEVTK